MPNCACTTQLKALLAQVSMFAMSAHGEPFLIARSIKHMSVGINALARLRTLDYAALMRPLLRDVPITNPTQAWATKYIGFSLAQQAVELVDAFERLARHNNHTGLLR